MTHDQIETRLHSRAKALVADPTDVKASATSSLLNDHAIHRWIRWVARKGNRGQPQKLNTKRSEANGYAASLPASKSTRWAPSHGCYAGTPAFSATDDGWRARESTWRPRGT